MFSFNIVFFGKSSTGKTKLIEQIKQLSSVDFRHYKATVGWNPSELIGEISSINEKVKLDIQDLSGTARTEKSMSIYLAAADVGLYCIDLTVAKDKTIQQDIELFKKTNPTAPLILVGTKADATTDQQAAIQRLAKLSQEFGCSKYFVSSAKTLQGVSDLKKTLFATINEQVSALNLLFFAEKLKANVAFHHAFIHLHDVCKNLAPEQYHAITLQAKQLIAILSRRFERNKIIAIEQFQSSCFAYIKGPHVKFNNGVIALFAMGLGALLAGTVGFLMGFGAIAAGYFTASLVLILASSCILVVSAGVYSYYQLDQDPLVFAAIEQVSNEAKKWEKKDYDAENISNSFQGFLSGFLSFKAHHLQKKNKEKSTSKSFQVAEDLQKGLTQGLTVKEVLSNPANQSRIPKRGAFFSMETLSPYITTAVADENYVPIKNH